MKSEREQGKMEKEGWMADGMSLLSSCKDTPIWFWGLGYKYVKLRVVIDFSLLL